MKKFLTMCVIGLALATTNVFADHPSSLGIGVVGGVGVGENFGGTAALSLKVPSLPIYWAIRADIGNGFGLGVSGDYYVIDKALVPDINLGWYFGVGGYVGLGGFDDKLSLALGARLPIGLSWQFLGHGEIFLEVAGQLGLRLLPSIHLPEGAFLNPSLGFRFWF